MYDKNNNKKIYLILYLIINYIYIKQNINIQTEEEKNN